MDLVLENIRSTQSKTQKRRRIGLTGDEDDDGEGQQHVPHVDDGLLRRQLREDVEQDDGDRLDVLWVG